MNQSDIKDVLSYDEATGVFVWKKWKHGRQKSLIAGTTNAEGYRIICVNRHVYKAHRLAWLYMTGEWPKYEIDHINGIKNDNRFINLRDVSRTANIRNQHKPHTGSKIGVLGVTSGRNKFRASITVKGKTIFLGNYDSVVEAKNAYENGKKIHHP